jgi:heme A synthase
MAVAALFVAQVLIGAVTVWLVFPAELQALHLAAATALWASMVLLVGLAITASPAPGAESSYA